MHLLSWLFSGVINAELLGYLAVGLAAAGANHFLNRWKSGKQLGTGKIKTHAAKVLAFAEPICSVIYPLPLITMSALQKVPLFIIASSALLLVELVRLIPEIRENLSTAIFCRKGMFVSGVLYKYEDADRCTVEGTCLHYIKNTKHFEIELEPELVKELKTMGM